MNFILNMFKKVFTWLGFALNLISDDLDNSNFRIIGVIFNPPIGSTVMVGESIEATVTYESDLVERESIRLWVQPNDDNLSGSYQPSELENTNGRLTRFVSINEETLLKNVCIQVNYISGEEIFFQNREVNYNIIANPEHEKIRGDGEDSKLVIEKILVDDFEIVSENPKVEVGSHVEVVIGYINTSMHGVRISALPDAKTEFHVAYDSSDLTSKNSGTITKSFIVHEAVVIDGIYVTMLNSVNELVADVWIEKHIDFY